MNETMAASNSATALRQKLADAWVMNAIGDRSAIKAAYVRQTGHPMTALGTALQTLADAGWTMRMVRHCAS